MQKATLLAEDKTETHTIWPNMPVDRAPAVQAPFPQTCAHLALGLRQMAV